MLMGVESTHDENTWHSMSAIAQQVKNQEAFGAAERCAPT
jgi:hypothetical protein